VHDTGDGKPFFSHLWMQLCTEPPSPRGEHGGVYGFQAARLLQDTMCARPADLIDNYDIRRVCVRMCDPGAGGHHEDSLSGDIGAEGDRPILECTTSEAAPTSPPEMVLRRTRHQEHWPAVGTHYGTTRIYGPKGHAIGGTALRSSSTAAIIARPRHYQ
jgi:hypothetical protein